MIIDKPVDTSLFSNVDPLEVTSSRGTSKAPWERLIPPLACLWEHLGPHTVSCCATRETLSKKLSQGALKFAPFEKRRAGFLGKNPIRAKRIPPFPGSKSV